MKNTLKVASTYALAVLTAASLLMPLAARSAEMPAVANALGNWTTVNLATDRDGWKVESHKLDRGLVAWTELSETLNKRRLFVFNGSSTKQVAEMPRDTWNDVADSGFYDTVTGSYDVADGLVVWVMSDGHDREIYAYDGADIRRISDNTYDDKHPITSRGRVAWTSAPGTIYNLMLKNTDGSWKRLDSWHVTNYAWSADNLYWLNRRANENWFRVFRYDGKSVAPVGEGDDRAIRNYFLSDDAGGVAWEYSTKNWDYDKRIVYAAYAGQQAYGVLQRDVPPNITRLEDFADGRVVVNATDLLTSLLNDTTLLAVNLSGSKALTRQLVASKAQVVNGGVIRHQTPETGSALMFTGFAGRDEIISLERVRKDIFDADKDLVAGAIIGGKLLISYQGKVEILNTASEVQEVRVRNGMVIWTEMINGAVALKAAMPNLLVRDASGVKSVAGGLIKSADASQIYLLGTDGKRYVFTAATQYFGWLPDFRAVRTVSSTAIGSAPLAGEVVYRAGSRLLRADNSSRVYMVGEGAKLHWLIAPDVARQACGENWARQVDVIPAKQLSGYPIGEPISDPFRMVLALAS